MPARNSWLSRLAFGLLWVLSFTVPFQDVVTIPGFGTISRLLGYITLVVAASAVVLLGHVRRFYWPSWAAFGFLGWASLSLAWSISAPSTLDWLPILLRNIGLFWLLYEYLHDAKTSQWIQAAYVLGCWVCIAGVIRSFVEGHSIGAPGAWAYRYVIGAKDVNDTACLLAVGIPMAVYLQARPGYHRLLQWFFRAYLPFTGLAILLTGSRGGLLAAVAAVASLFGNLSARRIRTLLIVGVAMAVLLIAVWDRLPEVLVARFQVLPSELEGGGTLTNRTTIWEAGLEVLPNHFVLGVGAGAYGDAILTRGGLERDVAHNTLLGILVEMGVVGAALFVSLLLSLAWRARRLPAAERWLCWGLLLSWLVASGSLTLEGNKTTWLVFGVVAAGVCPALVWTPGTRP